MLRYFAIATVIVLAAAVLATAWVNRDLIRIKIASVNASAPPKPLDSIPGPRRSVPFKGVAPWALSAVPGCLTQISVTTGPHAYVAAHLPAGATPVAPPATMTYGECTISVTGDEAYVRRGSDRFLIPPHVRFFRSGENLAVWRTDDSGGNELRIYAPSNL